MKRFIIDIIFGFVCFCLVWCAGEIVFDRFKGQNNYSYKYNYVKNNAGIKTLLIGHSHFENGLNPYLLGDSVFDFAISARGRWFGWEVGLAEALYPTMPNLRTVICPLHYGHPYTSPHYRKPMEDYTEECMYYYTRYMHVPYDRVPQKYKFYSSLYFNKMGLKYWEDEEHIDSLGFYPFEGKMDDWEGQQNVEDYSYYVGDIADSCYEEYVHNFIKLAKICNENGIRLIVVTTPHSDAFIKNTRPEIIAKMEAIVDSVRIHYPIEYRNYMMDEEFRADSIYYNASHLNSIGADMFALRLKKEFNL